MSRERIHRDTPIKPLSSKRCVLVGVAAAVAFSTATAMSGEPARGEAIFTGKEPIEGAIRGHRSHLTPEVVRCSNCHGTRDSKAPSSAPALTRFFLLDKMQRRGGPPSSYDRASFCKVLETGVDPAYVLISRVMPVYEMNDGQCSSLWDFLVEAPR